MEEFKCLFHYVAYVAQFSPRCSIIVFCFFLENKAVILYVDSKLGIVGDHRYAVILVRCWNGLSSVFGRSSSKPLLSQNLPSIEPHGLMYGLDWVRNIPQLNTHNLPLVPLLCRAMGLNWRLAPGFLFSWSHSNVADNDEERCKSLTMLFHIVQQATVLRRGEPERWQGKEAAGLPPRSAQPSTVVAGLHLPHEEKCTVDEEKSCGKGGRGIDGCFQTVFVKMLPTGLFYFVVCVCEVLSLPLRFYGGICFFFPLHP